MRPDDGNVDLVSAYRAQMKPGGPDERFGVERRVATQQAAKPGASPFLYRPVRRVRRRGDMLQKEETASRTQNSAYLSQGRRRILHRTQR